MTRVLFYNHTGLASGAERILLDTLASLDPNAFEIIAACPADGNLTSLIEAQGVPVHAVGKLEARFTSSPRQLVQYLGSFAKVILDFRKLVKTTAPDLLHANSVRAGLVATIATLGFGTPIVWHIHDDLPVHPISSPIRAVAFLSRRGTFLAVSQATAKAFQGSLSFGDRLHVLYNGVDLARFPAKTTRVSSFRDELGLTDDHFLLCAAGMINPRKGLSGLLDAFAAAAQSNPRLHLAIVGAPIFNRDDLHLAALQQQARDLDLQSRVHFTGARPDMPEVLRAADLLVLNALVEPFGLVLVEAMASGTPVLATRVGGIPEIVADNRTGFLTPSRDNAALAARILRLAADPAVCRQAAATALQEVCPRFSRQRYAEGFTRFLQTRFPLLFTAHNQTQATELQAPVTLHAQR